MRWDSEWKVVSSLKSFSKATVVISNDLDRPITVTLQGSWYKEFRWGDIVAAWNVTSISVGPKERRAIPVAEDFPYIRCQVKAETAPASGS
jgi:hypothetical protein